MIVATGVCVQVHTHTAIQGSTLGTAIRMDKARCCFSVLSGAFTEHSPTVNVALGSHFGLLEGRQVNPPPLVRSFDV
jgi:hypothetical protein